MEETRGAIISKCQSSLKLLHRLEGELVSKHSGYGGCDFLRLLKDLKGAVDSYLILMVEMGRLLEEDNQETLA
jgi:hypothetical protein